MSRACQVHSGFVSNQFLQFTDRPPKLPPRDTTSIYGASIWARPLGSQLSRGGAGTGGHMSRKDGNNNNPKKSRKSTGGKEI